MSVLDGNGETFCEYFHLLNPFFFFYRSEPLGSGLACLRNKNTGVSSPGISCSISLNHARRNGSRMSITRLNTYLSIFATVLVLGQAVPAMAVALPDFT